jgi:peptide/nickel transport system substrate-binding protein
MPKRTVAWIVLALAFVITPLSPAAPRAGGIFRVTESAGSIDSIDAALADTAGDVPYVTAVCSSLTRLADKPLPAGFRPVPELAESLPKISSNRKTYVFTLRKGLRFNTGAPVTATDVAYTIDRLLRIHSPLTPAFAQIIGAQAVAAGTATQAAGIVASGRRLIVRLLQPVGDFVENAASALCVVPAGTPLAPTGLTPPIPSAAPYYISEFVPGQRLVLKRNPFYRGNRPHHVNSFVFDLTVDDTQAIDDVLNGSSDYGWAPNLVFAGRAPELARRFGVNKKQFFVKPSPFLRMFVLNTSRPLLRGNVALRKAINFAVDRPALAAQFGAYAETPVDHYLPPIMPGYRDAHVYPLRGPNVARARALAHGHTRGGRLVLYVPTRPTPQAQAQIVKQDLKRIGLDVQVVSWPPGVYFDKLGNPKEPFDMAWVGWLANDPDPGSFLDTLFDGTTIKEPGNANWSYFNSTKWNIAFARASGLTGRARYRAFGKIDIELAREAAPAVAYGVDDALTLVSARTGCSVINPYLDLPSVCIK